MDDIKVIEMTSKEYEEFVEETYNKFLDYCLNTNLTAGDIYKKLDIPISSKLARYIRRRLRKEGYNVSKRAHLIKKGKWRV